MADDGTGYTIGPSHQVAKARRVVSFLRTAAIVTGTRWGASVGRFHLRLDDVLPASDELAEMRAFLDHACGMARKIAEGGAKTTMEGGGACFEDSAWAAMWERYGGVS